MQQSIVTSSITTMPHSASVTTSSLNSSQNRSDEVSVSRKRSRDDLTEETLVHQSPLKQKRFRTTTLPSIYNPYSVNTTSYYDKHDVPVNNSTMNYYSSYYYYSSYSAHRMMPSAAQSVSTTSYSFQQEFYI